ncbi:MAG: type II toxin-antitoxin system RelE/ParE family toxin [Myxococcota bacterium]
MPAFVLSRSAELDLDEIDLQTIERFGFDQADKTSATFLEAMHTLAATPEMGQLRPDLDPPGRTFRYWTVLRRFLIVYLPVQDGIRVARIINASRDLRAVLNRDPGDP